jgi:hypothetical protein
MFGLLPTLPTVPIDVAFGEDTLPADEDIYAHVFAVSGVDAIGFKGRLNHAEVYLHARKRHTAEGGGVAV